MDNNETKNSLEAWTHQYGKNGAKYIEEICSNVDKLKPIVEEIGWQVLDINNKETRIIVEFEKPNKKDDDI